MYNMCICILNERMLFRMTNIANDLIRTIMSKRGWTDADVEKFREPSIDDLHSPLELTDVKEYVERLHEYKNKKVLVMPDYDADGILSGSLVAGALSVFGFEQVDVYAPRIQTGYGVTIQSADEAIAEFGLPDAVVTTDNGATAFEGIEYLQDMGITVLVTDHHNATDVDTGDVNVNPMRPTDTYPFKGLSGATVAWKVMQAYALTYGDERQQRLIDYLVPLAGISVLSDVMPLVDENRFIVESSIELLQDTTFLAHGSNVDGTYGSIFSGLLALHSVCNDHGKFNYGFDESTFGFVFGPMLNSPRRMSGDSQIGFDVFLSDDHDETLTLAQELYDINEDRKSMMRKYSKNYLKDIYTAESVEEYAVGVVPYTHGMIGLLAGQFTNRFGFPSIVFSAKNASDVLFKDIDGEDIETLSGSARSPAWFNLHHAIAEIQADYPDMFNSFGGHSQAAGLSIKAEYYDTFRQEFIGKIVEELERISRGEGVEIEDSTVWIDWRQYTSVDLLALEGVIDFIESIKPFGQAFDEPAFGVEFSTENAHVQFMGADKQHVKFQLNNGLAIIQWNGADALRKQLGHKNGPFTFRVIGKLSVNEFRGNKTMQIIADHLVEVE